MKLNLQIKQLLDNLISDTDNLFTSRSKAVDNIKNLYAVDGAIVGTGQADYTQNSTEYNLYECGKKFCLIDVPGIEGNEKLYEKIIQKSLEKAHVIIYVTGSNKKIEPKTIQKIRKYLKNDTEVYFVCNVHCMPKLNRNTAIDGTYSEELKKSFDLAASSIFLQTEKELKDLLKNNYRKGFLINGLQGLCSSAFFKNESTLIPDNESKKIRTYQNKYLIEYENKIPLMQEESRLKELSNLIKNHVENYKDYILHSNFKKFMSRLKSAAQNIEKLEKETNKKIDELNEPYERFLKDCDEAKEDFDNGADVFIHKSVDTVIQEMIIELYEIIEKKKGRIKKADMESVLTARSEQIEENIEKQISENFNNLIKKNNDALSEAKKRFSEDVDFVLDQVKTEDNSLVFDEFQKVIDKILKDFMTNNLKKIGSDFLKAGFFVLDGFAIGSFFPGYGNIIGAIIGGVVSIGLIILSFFQTTEKRISTVKDKVTKQIEPLVDEITDKLEEKIKTDEMKNKNAEFIEDIKNKCSIQKKQLEEMLVCIRKINNNIEQKLDNYRIEAYGKF